MPNPVAWKRALSPNIASTASQSRADSQRECSINTPTSARRLASPSLPRSASQRLIQLCMLGDSIAANSLPRSRRSIAGQREPLGEQQKGRVVVITCANGRSTADLVFGNDGLNPAPVDDDHP